MLEKSLCGKELSAKFVLWRVFEVQCYFRSTLHIFHAKALKGIQLSRKKSVICFAGTFSFWCWHTYNKIEDIFDKNIFWRVKQAFVITHNCWRSIFENIMLTKLVMSYYLQSSFSIIIKPFSNCMLVPNLHLQKTWWHKPFFTISKNACQLLEAVSKRIILLQ